MRSRLIPPLFFIIGTAIGVILVIQIRTDPVSVGRSPLDQAEIQKSLLNTFSVEQAQLTKKIDELKAKRDDVNKLIEQRSSRAVLARVAHLKQLAGIEAISGAGISITVSDSPKVNRSDYSSVSDSFVQPTDLRDLVNVLFLQGASGVSINKNRVIPLTPIRSVFDTMLVGNIQVVSPFVIEAVGNEEALTAGVEQLPKKNIRVFVDKKQLVQLPPGGTFFTFNYTHPQQP